MLIKWCEEKSFWEDASFVSCSDGKIWVGFGKRIWHEKKPDHAAFYIPDFFLHLPKSWCTHTCIEKISRDDLLKSLSGIEIEKGKLEWENSSISLFKEEFHRLHKQFSENRLIKAVPYVKEIALCFMNRKRKISSLKAILEWSHLKPVSIYGFWENDQGMMGCTPEKIVESTQQGVLDTMACAGTHKDPVVLSKEVKLKNEHQIVIDSIAQSFSKVAAVEVGKTRPINVGTFYHLITPIRLKLEEHQIWDEVISLLHPTAALGAYPKEEGKKWLLAYDQKLPRGRFAAPFGFVTSSEAIFIAAIRGCQWEEELVSIYAGCGVIAESQIQEEITELEIKLKIIKKALAL